MELNEEQSEVAVLFFDKVKDELYILKLDMRVRYLDIQTMSELSKAMSKNKDEYLRDALNSCWAGYLELIVDNQFCEVKEEKGELIFYPTVTFEALMNFYVGLFELPV